MPLPSGKAEVQEVVSITRMSLGKSIEVQKAIPAVTVDSITPERIVFLPQQKLVRLFAPELRQPIEITGERFDALYATFSGDLQATIAKSIG